MLLYQHDACSQDIFLFKAETWSQIAASVVAAAQIRWPALFRTIETIWPSWAGVHELEGANVLSFSVCLPVSASSDNIDSPCCPNNIFGFRYLEKWWVESKLSEIYGLANIQSVLFLLCLSVLSINPIYSIFSYVLHIYHLLFFHPHSDTSEFHPYSAPSVWTLRWQGNDSGVFPYMCVRLLSLWVWFVQRNHVSWVWLCANIQSCLFARVVWECECICACVCVCVCEWVSERERERERESGVKFTPRSTQPGNDLVSAGEAKTAPLYVYVCVKVCYVFCVCVWVWVCVSNPGMTHKPSGGQMQVRKLLSLLSPSLPPVAVSSLS